MRASLLFIGLLVSASLGAQDIRQSLPVVAAGDVLTLRFDKSSAQLPLARFGTRALTVLEREQFWEVLVGIDLELAGGGYIVTFYAEHDQREPDVVTFIVERPKPLAMKHAAGLPEALFVPVHQEELSSHSSQPLLPLVKPVKRTNGDDIQWDDAFAAPIEFNQIGLRQNWIATPLLNTDQIIAPSNALVLRNDMSESGNTVLTLDHGRGVLSRLTFAGRASVKVGDGVVQGEEIGATTYSDNLSTRTTQIENPVLYWQVFLNGAAVNPIQFID